MGKKGKQTSKQQKVQMPEEEKEHEMILEEVQNISGKQMEKSDGSPPSRKRAANKVNEKLPTEEKINAKKRSISLPSSPIKLKKSTDEQKEADVDDIKTFPSEKGDPVPNFPDGWRRQAVVRKSGKTAGQIDIYYYSPEGAKLRSRPDVASYLTKHKGDLKIEAFDFSKTTKTAESVVKKKDSTENSTVLRKKRKSVDDENLEDGLELKDSLKTVSPNKPKPSEKSSLKKKDSTGINTVPRKKSKSVENENSEDGLELKDSSKSVSTNKPKPSEKSSVKKKDITETITVLRKKSKSVENENTEDGLKLKDSSKPVSTNKPKPSEKSSVKKKDTTEISTVLRKKSKSVENENSEDKLELKDSSKPVSTNKPKPSEKSSAKKKDTTEISTVPRKKSKSVENENSEDMLELKDSSKPEKSTFSEIPPSDDEEKNGSDEKPIKVVVKILDSKPKRTRK